MFTSSHFITLNQRKGKEKEYAQIGIHYSCKYLTSDGEVIDTKEITEKVISLYPDHLGLTPEQQLGELITFLPIDEKRECYPSSISYCGMKKTISLDISSFEELKKLYHRSVLTSKN